MQKIGPGFSTLSNFIWFIITFFQIFCPGLQTVEFQNKIYPHIVNIIFVISFQYGNLEYQKKQSKDKERKTATINLIIFHINSKNVTQNEYLFL